MSKVINMQQWIKEHRWEEPYADYEFDAETKAMFDYIDESLEILNDNLISILIIEGVIPDDDKYK